MSEKILVPVLGESINEATVSKWLKNVGDVVNVDEAIVELETDKVNLEVPASISGVLSEINSNEGEAVKVGSVLGIISDSNVKISGKENVKNKKIEIKEKEEKIYNKYEKNNKEDLTIQTEPTILNEEEPLILNEEEEPLILNEEEEPLILKEEVQIEEKQGEPIQKDINLSPAVRKIVDEKKIDISKIKGTGRDGRILKGDLVTLMG